MLKYRLQSKKNKKYLEFLRVPGKIVHHFTKGFKGKKHNDYLAYSVIHEQHEDIHVRGIEDEEGAVLQIIENLISYIEHLERK